jgi:hypothetical protein
VALELLCQEGVVAVAALVLELFGQDGVTAVKVAKAIALDR